MAIAGGAAVPALADGFEGEPEGLLEVTADRLEYDNKKKLYVAAGRVRVVQADRSLDADWLAFSSQTKLGVASGHVRVVHGKDVLLADFFEFNVDTLEGVVFAGDLDNGEGEFLVRARQLAKTGEDCYELRDGTFTTCRCPEGKRLPWTLRAKHARFDIGGYATTRNTTVEVLGVPVLWLPWAIFPIKAKRQSGLLFPEFRLGGNNGFQIGVPIFWAAHDRLNATFTPEYLSKRGFKPRLDLEYVQGQRSGGRLQGSFIRDDVTADEAPSTREFSPNRWSLIWNHDQHLPADWRFKADVKLASDFRYARDFEDLERYRNYRHLESSVFAFNHFGADGRFGATAAVRWADDQQVAGSPFLLQRLPELRFDILPAVVTQLPGLVASMPTNYTYFSSFGDKRVGRPNGGSRLFFHPRLAYPVRLFDRFELHPEIGYYETLYQPNGASFSQRGLVTARVDLRSRIDGKLKLPFLKPLRHLIEVSARWTYVQDREASQGDSDTLFVPRDVSQEFLRQLEPENIVLDPSDDIPHANLLTVGFGNRIYSPRGKGPQRLLADVTFSAGYDFARDRWARLNVDGATFPRGGVRTRFMLSVDPNEAQIEEALMEAATALPERGWFEGGAVGMSYRFRRELPTFADIDRVSQIGLFTRLELGPRWTLSYAFNYSLAGGLLLQNRGGLAYTSACHCWKLAIEARQDRTRGVEFRVGFTLLGLGDAAAATTRPLIR